MAAKSANSRTRRETRFSADELGLPQVPGDAVGRPGDGAWLDPFQRMKASLRNGQSALKDAALRVHDGLDMARTIAMSIYGPRWEPHVIEVFDRLQLLMHEEQDRNTHTGTDEPLDGAH